VSLREPTHRAVGTEPEFGRDALIVCDNLLRVYQTDLVEVQALQGLDLLVYAGEMVAIVGASGSGKSTLLQVLAGVDAPTAGRARVAGHDLLTMTRRERVHYRRHVVGFVRQQSVRNLVPYLTADQVVDLPMTIAASVADAAWSCWRPWASATVHTCDRTRCPAVSNSGWRSA
jgi:ABC-type lipoprotein export system ATPase subunit